MNSMINGREKIWQTPALPEPQSTATMIYTDMKVSTPITDRVLAMPEPHRSTADKVYTITVNGEQQPYLLAKMPRTGYYLFHLDGMMVDINGVKTNTPKQAATYLFSRVLDAGTTKTGEA